MLGLFLKTAVNQGSQPQFGCPVLEPKTTVNTQKYVPILKTFVVLQHNFAPVRFSADFSL